MTDFEWGQIHRKRHCYTHKSGATISLVSVDTDRLLGSAAASHVHFLGQQPMQPMRNDMLMQEHARRRLNLLCIASWAASYWRGIDNLILNHAVDVATTDSSVPEMDSGTLSVTRLQVLCVRLPLALRRHVVRPVPAQQAVAERYR